MTASSTARSCTRINQTLCAYSSITQSLQLTTRTLCPHVSPNGSTFNRILAPQGPETPPPPTVWGKTFKNRVSPLRRYRSWQTSMAGFRLSVTRTVAANQTVASTAPHETPEEWPPSLPYKLMHKRQSERLAGFEQTKQKMMARVHRRPKI